MQITGIKLIKTNGSDTLLANASVELDGCIGISGIRVFKDNDGQPFVVYPSRKNAKGEDKEICFPMKKALREDIEIQLIKKYEELR